MLKYTSRAIILFSVLAIAIAHSPAYSATITTYTSQSSWNAATSGDQSVSVDGMAPSGSYTVYSSITAGGVQFIGLSGSTIGVMDTSAFSWADFNSGDAVFTSGGAESIQITLPAGVTAFSLEMFTSPPSVSITASVSGTQVTVPTFSQPTQAFFGVTSDTPITTIDLTAQPGASYAFFDDFEFGTAQVTSQAPEAGTFLLIGSGLLGLALVRRRVR